MSILQQRKSIVGFIVGALAGFVLIAALGQRNWETPAQAASQSALERKVNNLQNNLTTMQTKLNRSVDRIELLEDAMTGIVSGDIPAGDAYALGGLGPEEYALASEVGPELSFGNGLSRSGDTVSLDYTTLDANYLPRTGGSVGPLTVSGYVDVNGFVITNRPIQIGSNVGKIPVGGMIRFEEGTGNLRVFDGTQWNTIRHE